MASPDKPKPMDYKPVLPATSTLEWLKRNRILGLPGVVRKNDIHLPSKQRETSYATVFQLGHADDNLPILAGMSNNKWSPEENRREAERSRRVRDAARRRMRELKGFSLPPGHPEVVVAPDLTNDEWDDFINDPSRLSPDKPRIMVTQDNTIQDPRVAAPVPGDRGYAYILHNDNSAFLNSHGVLSQYHQSPDSGVIYAPNRRTLRRAPLVMRDQPVVADKKRIGELLLSNIAPYDRDHEFKGHGGVGQVATSSARDKHGEMTGARKVLESAGDAWQTDTNGEDTDDEYFLKDVAELGGGARQHKNQLWNFAKLQADTFPQFISNMLRSGVLKTDETGKLIPGDNYDAYHPYGEGSKALMGTSQYIRIYNAIQSYIAKVRRNPSERDPEVDRAILKIFNLWEQASADPARYRQLYRTNPSPARGDIGHA